MSRRGSGKAALGTHGEMDRKTPSAEAAAWRHRFPAQPRRGNRWLLCASGLLFLVWLGVLAWLAFGGLG